MNRTFQKFIVIVLISTSTISTPVFAGNGGAVGAIVGILLLGAFGEHQERQLRKPIIKATANEINSRAEINHSVARNIVPALGRQIDKGAPVSVSNFSSPYGGGFGACTGNGQTQQQLPNGVWVTVPAGSMLTYNKEGMPVYVPIR